MNSENGNGGERFTGHGSEWTDANLSKEDAHVATVWVDQIINKRSMLTNKDRVEDVRDIMWELENNRLIEENKVRQIEAVITAQLEQLAKEAFPATARLVSDFVRSRDEDVRTRAVEGYREISRRLAEIIKAMEQAETLAALLEELRNVINLETDAIADVKRRIKNREDSLFQRKKPKKNKD